MAFPKEHRAELYSTNPIERLNGEIKRRTNVVGIFTNEANITRLISAILLGQNGEWAVQRGRYMSLETMPLLSDGSIVVLSAVLGTWPAKTDAENRSGSEKLHHALGHYLCMLAKSGFSMTQNTLASHSQTGVLAIVR